MFWPLMTLLAGKNDEQTWRLQHRILYRCQKALALLLPCHLVSHLTLLQGENCLDSWHMKRRHSACNLAGDKNLSMLSNAIHCSCVLYYYNWHVLWKVQLPGVRSALHGRRRSTSRTHTHSARSQWWRWQNDKKVATLAIPRVYARIVTLIIKNCNNSN